MIVDRTKEIESFVEEVYEQTLNEKDEIYPLFSVLKETMSELSTFKKILQLYEKKIECYFSLIEEKERETELDKIDELYKEIKEKMDVVKRNLKTIETEYLNKSDQSYEIQYKFIASSFLKKCDLFFKLKKRFKLKKEKEFKRRLRILHNSLKEEEIQEYMKSTKIDKIFELYKEKLSKSEKYQIDIEVKSMKDTQNELDELTLIFNEVLDIFQEVFILSNLQDSAIDNVEFVIESKHEKIKQSLKKKKRPKKDKCLVM